MLMRLATRVTRRLLVGPDQDFSFQPARHVCLPAMERIGLYLHIPFCRSWCPYCPYHRIPYTAHLISPYRRAVFQEIQHYRQRLGRTEVSSLYVGGGTPTLLKNDLMLILEEIQRQFTVTGDICVETNPEDISPALLRDLVDAGVSLLSLGVQSFQDDLLQLLGRPYSAADLPHGIEQALACGMKTVNLDLMFALPGQSLSQLQEDVDRAIATGAHQVTAYPLFCFPHSRAGRYLRLKRLRMPPLVQRKRMYELIYTTMLQGGYTPVSVWGFKRGLTPRYSSVTREHYLGLGAGAVSHIPGYMYVNTFSVPHYIQACAEGRWPVALQLDMSPALSAFHWLYWRLYETEVPEADLTRVFGQTATRARAVLTVLRWLGMTEAREGRLGLNRRGAFWVHWAQNHFALNYVNRLWSIAGESPYPPRVTL